MKGKLNQRGKPRTRLVRGELLLLAFSIILLDQISKNYAQAKWSVACNKGIAFGIGLPDPVGVIIALIVLPVIFYLMIREKKTPSAIGMSLIFAGGISNLIDRLTLGCVRDFIDFKIWPSFNLADSAITLGIGIILLALIPKRSKKTQV